MDSLPLLPPPATATSPSPSHCCSGSSCFAPTVFPDLNIVPKIEPKAETSCEEHPESDEPSSISPEEQTDNSGEDDLFSEYYRLAGLFFSSLARVDGKNSLADGGEGKGMNAREMSIVPTLAESDWAGMLNYSKRKKVEPRSSEMVRVSSLGELDQSYFREQVRKARTTFESLRILICRNEEKNGVSDSAGCKRTRADLKAAALMLERNLWINRDKRIVGAIPGINVGDIFFFRMELCVLGLHGQVQGGIDYVPANRNSVGQPIALSIVVSGGYEDDQDRGNVIVYTGHGGRSRNMIRHSVNQKPTRGNLSLERSMHYGIEVRVIRGFKCNVSPSTKVYVYDGLYSVTEHWEDVGKSGFTVFKYKLVRIAGQEEMGSINLKMATELKERLLSSPPPTGYLINDISFRKENFPVSLFNDIDDDRDPMLYEYRARPLYPESVILKNNPHGNLGSGGCICTTGCSQNCPCIERNGGDFPYDANGILVMGKPLVYECGCRCRCPSTCRNRVTQNGVKHRLEVFRSCDARWGVRSLDLIRAGAFICEFAGIVLTEQQTELVSVNGESLVFPHRFPNRWYEWGDISLVVPGHGRPMFPSSPPVGFSVDMSRLRNAACYLSHSSSRPNVFLQFVLHDHYDVPYPHLMIFAMENIPPLRELCIDYGVGHASLLKSPPSGTDLPVHNKYGLG